MQLLNQGRNARRWSEQINISAPLYGSLSVSTISMSMRERSDRVATKPLRFQLLLRVGRRCSMQ